MRNLILIMLCLLPMGLTGCTSIASTMIERDEFNMGWEKHRCLRGIPITLKVPTHLKLYVFDIHYLELVNVGGVQEVQPVNLDVPIRDFAHELMYTDKIFTVDFKRPAAGSFNLRLDMTEDQYFAKIQHDVTDETIAKVTELLAGVLPDTGLFGKLASDQGTDKPDPKIVRALVAVGVFEIEAPDFSQQVGAFLDCHINKAHDAWVVPPYVQEFKRLGIRGPNTYVPYPVQPLCPNGACCAPDGVNPLPTPIDAVVE